MIKYKITYWVSDELLPGSVVGAEGGVEEGDHDVTTHHRHPEEHTQTLGTVIYVDTSRD